MTYENIFVDKIDIGNERPDVLQGHNSHTTYRDPHHRAATHDSILIRCFLGNFVN